MSSSLSMAGFRFVVSLISNSAAFHSTRVVSTSIAWMVFRYAWPALRMMPVRFTLPSMSVYLLLRLI